MPNIVPSRIEGVVDDSVGTTLVTIDRAYVVITTEETELAVPFTGQIWPRGMPYLTALAAPATPTRRNSFAGIPSGTAVTTGNSGGISGDAFDKVDTTGGTVVVNTSADLTAAFDRGMIVTLAAAQSAYVSWTLPISTAGYFRLYFRVAAMPSADTRLIRLMAANDTTSLWSVRLMATGYLAAYDLNGVARHQSTSPLSTNTIYRVEVKATSDQLTVKHFLGESTTEQAMNASTPSAQTSWGVVRFGAMTNLNASPVIQMAAVAWAPDDWIGPQT